MSTKLLWHSNAPWAPTGYGQQTAEFTPHLADHYDVAISSFYGLEGAPRGWKGIPVLPGMGGEYGSQTMLDHAGRFFDGNLRAGTVFTLLDVWVLDAAKAAQLNMACWVPVDHDPAPPLVVDFFAQSGAVPVAMSKFGQRMLGRLDPLYVPHGIDTGIYRPFDETDARGGSFPEDAFVVGMVAANKGRPSRKGFAQALAAFARFARDHDDAYLYLHTLLDPNLAGGENIPALMRSLEIPLDRVRVSDQYAMLYKPYPAEDMARIYSALDVLLNPALGEGFGIPVLEAQACGTPAIVTDFSAMQEVCGAGWHVKHTPYWTGLNSWQAVPDIDDIVDALEQCHGRSDVECRKMAEAARRHACEYDTQKVLKQHMLPALRHVEQRFRDQGAEVIEPAAISQNQARKRAGLPTVDEAAA
jgi:glycosyltransferase involved in cell wall biosynthesis